jgi:hypothetical protein
MFDSLALVGGFSELKALLNALTPDTRLSACCHPGDHVQCSAYQGCIRLWLRKDGKTYAMNLIVGPV